MAKKKIRTISLVDFSDSGVAVSGSTIPGPPPSSIPSPVAGSPHFTFGSLAPVPFMSGLASLPSPSLGFGLLSVSPIHSGAVSIPSNSVEVGLSSKEGAPAIFQASSPPVSEVRPLSGAPQSVQNGSPPSEVKTPEVRNYAALLKSSAQLHQLGTPVEHVSGAPFVLIPDENIEAAKLEFKDFIYARFHGDYPTMGKIIGIVNAVWAKSGPRIFVHNLGHGTYLLRVPNPRTREVLLARTCWNIGGLPMFVAPWAPDYSPEEPPLTDAIVPVEMRNVPYLLFNNESLSRIATAVGKPESLAPETERKENFEVAKLFVRVDLTAPLPHKIISGFSNGREVEIDVSYPWLPVQCDLCKKYGHISSKCTEVVVERVVRQEGPRTSPPDSSRRRSKSRPGRSTEKRIKQGLLRYVPVERSSPEARNETLSDVPPVVSAEGNVLAPSTQVVASEDLEEGEIRQLPMAETAVPQTSMDLNVSPPPSDDVKQPVIDNQQAEIHDTELFVAAITDAISVAVSQEDILLGGSVSVDVNLSQATGVLLLSESDQVVTTDHPTLPVEAIHETTESAFLPEVPDVTEVLSQGVMVPQEVSPSDATCDPAQDEERENPFILVNNRKSSRKASKSSRKARNRH